MKTIETIITKHGGLEALKEHAIAIENKPYMKLCIEYIGQGPRNKPLISVAHYGEQNGDAMRDPDMVFEVETFDGFTTDSGKPFLWGWYPVSFRNDYVGLYQEATWEENGKVLTKPVLVKHLTMFAKEWDRNIAEQGFLIAQKQAQS